MTLLRSAVLRLPTIAHFCIILTVSIVFTLAISFLFPIYLHAQETITSSTSTNATASTTIYNDGSTQSREARRQNFRDWRQRSNELEQKITALGSTVVISIPVPVLFGVSLNNISPNFGAYRPVNRTHEGEDIMAVKGTPIVSPTPAVVIRIGTGPSEGNFVSTANPGGEVFVYMHLDKIGEGVVEGAVLATGSLIGYIGNTGNASGGAAHLHFEIHDSTGTPTNPFPRLSAEFTIAQKIAYLIKIFSQTTDGANLAQHLVLNFRSTFNTASAQGIALPPPIAQALVSGPSTPPTLSVPNNTTPTVGSGVLFILSRNLYQGISGDDVRVLQRVLNKYGYTVASSGAGSPGNETAYFGPATRSAVTRFQSARSVSPTAGYVGPLTRGILTTLVI